MHGNYECLWLERYCLLQCVQQFVVFVNIVLIVARAGNSPATIYFLVCSQRLVGPVELLIRIDYLHLHGSGTLIKYMHKCFICQKNYLVVLLFICVKIDNMYLKFIFASFLAPIYVVKQSGPRINWHFINYEKNACLFIWKESQGPLCVLNCLIKFITQINSVL